MAEEFDNLAEQGADRWQELFRRRRQRLKPRPLPGARGGIDGQHGYPSLMAGSQIEVGDADGERSAHEQDDVGLFGQSLRLFKAVVQVLEVILIKEEDVCPQYGLALRATRKIGSIRRGPESGEVDSGQIERATR